MKINNISQNTPQKQLYNKNNIIASQMENLTKYNFHINMPTTNLIHITNNTHLQFDYIYYFFYIIATYMIITHFSYSIPNLYCMPYIHPQKTNIFTSQNYYSTG